MNTDSGGCARKRAAMSVTLTSVKRVQSSPNLLAAGRDSQSPDSAKGFRSVRPNLQEKRSATQLGNQNLPASVLEVNASQTHRQITPEASPPCPPSVVPLNRATFSPGSGTSSASLSLP
ncbi:SORBS2 isoform 50, partial [Pongo abelii]